MLVVVLLCQVARAEAKCIDESYKGGQVPTGRVMRLHAAGDSRTVAGSRAINKAVGRWKARGGGDCWWYTHAWAYVPKSVWSNVSVLASVESTSEAGSHRAQGYAPAIVVDHHTTDKAYSVAWSDTKFIPCPAQTREVGCSDCKLCFNTDRLFAANLGISFAVHGTQTNKLKRHLQVIADYQLEEVEEQ